MPLTDPTPIIYQNLNNALDLAERNNKPEPEKKGLLYSPKVNKPKEDVDASNPMNRVASYVSKIRNLRNEISNG
tara:strand:+ start:61 stop:282 length:222 start_codon:yes stop_codon:yes gene_type:complete